MLRRSFRQILSVESSAALECAGALLGDPNVRATKNAPIGACLCPLQRPSSGAGAGLWVWLRSRAACDRQS